MMSQEAKLRLYWALPQVLRSAAATAKGVSLNRWRYGPETERIAHEALERDVWPRERLERWQQERLSRVLERAATQVPYYRRQWARRRRAGDRASPELLQNWPVLEKEALRAEPEAFIAEDRDLRRMYRERTSGSTGRALDLYWSRHTVRAWYALREARCRMWYGVTRADRWALVAGQLVTPVAQRKPPFWVWNAAARQLYMSCYHLSSDLVPHYFEALERYRITNLVGYPSALYELALGARAIGSAPRMKVVVTNSEPLYPHQKEAIAVAFDCPVRETYGMAEIVATSTECEHGRQHLWPEAGILEVFAGTEPLLPGETGDLVGTGLLNDDMPLIRYRIGDTGNLPAVDEACACGRTLPTLEAVEGRLDDVVYTRDGRAVGRLHAPVFKSRLPVMEAQIIQESLERLRVRYVPDADFDEAAKDAIVRRLRSRLGPVEVELEAVPEVPRGASGKFRAVLCSLPPEERERLAATAGERPRNRSEAGG